MLRRFLLPVVQSGPVQLYDPGSSSGTFSRAYSRTIIYSCSLIWNTWIIGKLLQDVCLQTRLLFPELTDVSEFLDTAPDSPPIANVKSALQLLEVSKQVEILTECNFKVKIGFQTIGAFTSDQLLTSLGRRLVELPLEPQYAKMIFYAILFRCIDPVLTIIACLSHRDPCMCFKSSRFFLLKLCLSFCQLFWQKIVPTKSPLLQ